jgi:inner membrane protein
MIRRAFTPGNYLVAWIRLAVFARLIWDFQGWLFWFALGGAIHWFCDALTVSGAPVGWWSVSATSFL